MGGSGFTELDLSSHGHFGMSERGHSSQNTRTPPNCARCRNHDVILPLKGHKRYCKYIECTCEKCLLTAERQKVMARQTAIRRAEEQDRQRLKNGLPVPGRVVTPPLRSPAAAVPLAPAGGHDHDLDHSECRGRSSISPAPDVTTAAVTGVPRRPPSPKRQTSNNGAKTSKEMWDKILLLQEWCRLPLNTTPLFQIILSEVTPDASTVYKLFTEAQEELRKTSPIKEEVWHQTAAVERFNHLMYYPPVLPQPSTSPYKQLYPMSAHHRFNPYRYTGGLLPPSYKGIIGGLDTFSYLPIHESTRPSVLVSTERLDFCYNPDDRKPTSPSSVYSDKSSYSGSVDT